MLTMDKKFQEADIVFIGRMMDITPAPQAASGAIASFRVATYQVDKMLKGKAGPGPLEISHYVVDQDRDMQPADSQSPYTPFRRGEKLLVYAVNTEDFVTPGQFHYQEISYAGGATELGYSLPAALQRAYGNRILAFIFSILRRLFRRP